jgi:predicted MFS family arabinose efflux permease
MTESTSGLATAIEAASEGAELPTAIIFLLAGASACIAAGSYFARPMTALIGPEIGLSPWMVGLIVTVSQLGFVAGLLLIVPLGDLLENRRLLMVTLLASAIALAAAAIAPTGPIFLLASFGIGVASVAVQMIVAIAASLSSEAGRGKAVGTVTSGLLIGMLLAWPIASLLADRAGWRMVFAGDALLVVSLIPILVRALPDRHPLGGERYTALVRSLWGLLRTTPVVRRRGGMQALLFGAFSLFWTAVPMELSRRFNLAGVSWPCSESPARAAP